MITRRRGTRAAGTLAACLMVAAVSAAAGTTTSAATSATAASIATGAAAASGMIATTDTDAGPDTTAGPAGTSTAAGSVVAATRDGEELTIGVLLPTTGPGQVLGNVGVSAVSRVVHDEAAGINALGGVNGHPINLVFVDEGADAESARAQVRALIEQDVDAVIGPASSTVALAVLPELMDAGIVTCSPTASSLQLDSLPNRGYFFRTIASDSLLMHALSYATRNRVGSLGASVIYVDDEYGRGLFNSLRGYLSEQGVELLDAVAIAPSDDDLADDIGPVVQNYADRPMIVLGDATHGYRILAALSAMADRFPDTPEQPIFVNEAITAPAPDIAAALHPRIRTAVQRISRQAYPQPLSGIDLPVFPDGPFAVNALLCVETIAIAAQLRGSNHPADFVGRMVDVTVSGVQCFTFRPCVESGTAGIDIDYSGPAGGFSLLERGDPNGAAMVIYGIGPNGVEEQGSTFEVTAPEFYRDQTSRNPLRS